MACKDKIGIEIKPNQEGIDFVKLEKVILQVSDNCGIIKDLLYAMLRTTETYCNCIDEYNLYIKKYADFLSSLNIKDNDMVAMMYKRMLDSGYLSYNKKHKYDKSFKNIYNKSIQIAAFMDLDELEGCYITTGSFICRHMSSFLTDLEGRVGNEAYNAYVALHSRKIDKFRVHDDGVIANHQITLLEDDHGFYGYCPTSDYFVEFIDNDMSNQLIIGRSVDSDKVTDDFYYYMFFSDYDLIVEEQNENIISLFNDETHNKYKKLDLDELAEKENIIDTILINKKDEFDSFYEDTKSSLNTINNLLKTMVPKKNIKKLIIK